MNVEILFYFLILIGYNNAKSFLSSVNEHWNVNNFNFNVIMHLIRGAKVIEIPLK